MDEKTNTFVDRVESAVKAMTYRHSTEAQDVLFDRDAPALCAIVREQAAEIERLRALIPKPPQCWCVGSENPPAGMFGEIRFESGDAVPLGSPHRNGCSNA